MRSIQNNKLNEKYDGQKLHIFFIILDINRNGRGI